MHEDKDITVYAEQKEHSEKTKHKVSKIKNATIKINTELVKISNFIFKENFASILFIVSIIILLIVFGLFFSNPSESIDITKPISEEKIAQFGDFFGGVIGSIFALVGVILFYVSLKEQREAIKENQEALGKQLGVLNSQIKIYKEQIVEQKETKKIFEKQNEIMNIQLFESSFYSLLNVFIENKQKLSRTDILENVLDFDDNLPSSITHDSLLKNVENKISNNIRTKANELNVFFISLYRLMKIIEDGHLSDIQKTQYHKILRTTLNERELLLIYYNYRQKDIIKPIPIALKYNYFKHLPFLKKNELKLFEFSDISSSHFLDLKMQLESKFEETYQKAQDMTQNDFKCSFQLSKIMFEIDCEDLVSISFGFKEIEHIRVLLEEASNLKNTYDINIDEDCINYYSLIFKVILYDILFSAKFKDETLPLQEQFITEKEPPYNTVKYTIEGYK